MDVGESQSSLIKHSLVNVEGEKRCWGWRGHSNKAKTAVEGYRRMVTCGLKDTSLLMRSRQDMVVEESGTMKVELCPGLTKVITAEGEGLATPISGDTVKGNEWPLILYPDCCNKKKFVEAIER